MATGKIEDHKLRGSEAALPKDVILKEMPPCFREMGEMGYAGA